MLDCMQERYFFQCYKIIDSKVNVITYHINVTKKLKTLLPNIYIALLKCI